MDPTALQHLQALAKQHALDISNAKIRRTSSRFCLGVEHGDYNGTNLFGVGTDRYIWVAYKANNTNTIRLASGNFPDDGLITFASGSYPTPPLTEQQSKSWARFPHGVDFVLRKEGLLQQSVGFDAVIWGNIPGGGMSRFLSGVLRVASMASTAAMSSRSASLCLNLIATWLDVNEATLPPPAPGSLAREVELAVQVENAYVGSPCGNLDQIMIWWRRRVEFNRGDGVEVRRVLCRGDGVGSGRTWGAPIRQPSDARSHARANAGTLYEPERKKISYIPLGAGAPDFAFVALDTGTDRPGLEKSTYKIRREECDAFAEELFAKSFINRPVLADVKVQDLGKIRDAYTDTKWVPHSKRLTYLVDAQMNFGGMIDAWRRGDVEEVGAYFRRDGRGLRDLYRISGPELETMCDIARTVEGVYGERMLGGGDKGAAGAIVRADAVAALKAAVARAYPLAHPLYKSAVHEVRVTTGVATFEGAL